MKCRIWDQKGSSTLEDKLPLLPWAFYTNVSEAETKLLPLLRLFVLHCITKSLLRSAYVTLNATAGWLPLVTDDEYAITAIYPAIGTQELPVASRRAGSINPTIQRPERAFRVQR